MSDIVQRLLKGELTQDEKRGVSEFGKEMMSKQEEILVNHILSVEQKLAMFLDLKQRIKDGNSPDEIARDLVATFEEHLQEFNSGEKEFHNNKTNKRGLFRRIE